MYTKIKTKKLLSISVLFMVIFNTGYADDALDVKNHINNMRSSTIQAGILGEVFTKIFDTNGKIKDAFLSFVNIATDGFIPFWGGGQLLNSPIYSISGNVGIGTTTLLEKLTVAGGISITKDPDSNDDVGDRGYNDGRYLGIIAKAADSDKLDGYDSSESSTPSTVAVRNSSGDINARLFRSEYDSSNPTVNFIMTQIDTVSNNFIRPTTPAQFRASVTDGSYLGITAKSSDSNSLDGIDSTSFVRSDVDDDISGNHNFWGTDILGNYSTAPIEVREVNQVGVAQSSEAYAPAITWHWGGRVQGQLSLESDSIFHFRDGVTHTTLKKVNASGYQENGVDLSSKYLGITAKVADSELLDGINSTSFIRSDADDTITGKISVGSTATRSAGMYGIYDSYKVGHIWSMGPAYQVADDGSTFGNLYGLAYKHTNNTTGGTMAGGHQMVWTQNGVGTSAIGSNIRTSGNVTAGMVKTTCIGNCF